MKEIKVKLIGVLNPIRVMTIGMLNPIRVIASGFPKPSYMFSTYRDYMRTVAKVLIMMFTKSIGTNIEKASSIIGMRFLSKTTHVDYFASKANFLMKLFAKIRSYDHSTDMAKVSMSLFTKGTHVDYSSVYSNPVLRFKANGADKHIDNSRASTHMGTAISSSYVDYAVSTMMTKIKEFAYSQSTDASRIQMSNIYKMHVSMKHVDVDNSRMKIMSAKPVYLKTLASMTLGKMSTETLKQLTSTDI